MSNLMISILYINKVAHVRVGCGEHPSLNNVNEKMTSVNLDLEIKLILLKLQRFKTQFITYALSKRSIADR